MLTGVGKSILSQFPGWQRILEQAASSGQLCMCPVTFAEISPGHSDVEAVLRDLSLLASCCEEIFPEAAFLAGEIC